MLPSRLSRASALVLVALMLVTYIPFRVFADEGMFLPDAIASLPLDKLARRGLKLKPTDFYNPNGVSIMEAVVIFDCGTGDFGCSVIILLMNQSIFLELVVSVLMQSDAYLM